MKPLRGLAGVDPDGLRGGEQVVRLEEGVAHLEDERVLDEARERLSFGDQGVDALGLLALEAISTEMPL